MEGILLAPLLVGEEVRGIQHVVAQVLERRAMKLIGAALGDDAHLSAGSPAEFCGGYAGLHSKLLHRVRYPEVTQRRVDLRIDVAHSIQQEHVRLRARTRDIKSPALRTRRRGHHARSYQRQIQILPSIERHVRYHLAVHYAAQRASVRFQQRRRGVNFNYLQNAPNLQSHIHVRDLVDLHHDVLFCHLLEARKFPLVSLTASVLAFLARSVSVNLAPATAPPVRSFTDPAMLPVGEADTAVATRNTMSARALNSSRR